MVFDQSFAAAIRKASMPYAYGWLLLVLLSWLGHAGLPRAAFCPKFWHNLACHT